VVFVADDNTRLTPTDQLIPILLDECNAAGVADHQITVIIALGTHRFMTEAEILANSAKRPVRRVRIKNHPYKELAALVDLGVTDNGGRILINKTLLKPTSKSGLAASYRTIFPATPAGQNRSARRFRRGYYCLHPFAVGAGAAVLSWCAGKPGPGRPGFDGPQGGA